MVKPETVIAGHRRDELPEHAPLGKAPTVREMWDLHDCAWSQLLQELWRWHPQRPRDGDAIQEMLRRAQHDEEMLNKLLEYPKELQSSAEPCPYRKCYAARTPLKSATFERMNLDRANQAIGT